MGSPFHSRVHSRSMSVDCFVIPSFMMAGTVSSSAPFPISVPLAVAVFTVPLDASHSRKQGEGET